MPTKNQQVAEVVEGMGLGLAALGVSRVPSSKLALEFAFSYAWRRWTYADEYPSIGRAAKPDNEFWIGVTHSERRMNATVVWQQDGRQYDITYDRELSTLDELANDIGDRPLNQWIDLAKPFREHLETHSMP